jgi:hypothetical protein
MEWDLNSAVVDILFLGAEIGWKCYQRQISLPGSLSSYLLCVFMTCGARNRATLEQRSGNVNAL